MTGLLQRGVTPHSSIFTLSLVSELKRAWDYSSGVNAIVPLKSSFLGVLRGKYRVGKQTFATPSPSLFAVRQPLQTATVDVELSYCPKSRRLLRPWLPSCGHVDSIPIVIPAYSRQAVDLVPLEWHFNGTKSTARSTVTPHRWTLSS